MDKNDENFERWLEVQIRKNCFITSYYLFSVSRSLLSITVAQLAYDQRVFNPFTSLINNNNSRH